MADHTRMRNALRLVRSSLPAIVACCLLSSACSLHSAQKEAPPELSARSEALAERAQAQAPLVERQLIRTVSLELAVDDVAQARKRAEALLASAPGSFVQALDSNHYSRSLQVELTLRVPKDKLDALLGKLRALGTVQHENQSVEDVTHKYIDVDARLRNMAQTEQRLLTLLSASQGGLSDVLAVERELARIREESEVLTSEMRALKEQIGLSTLKLRLEQESAFEPPPSLWSPLKNLWRDFGAILAQSLGALVSFAATLLTWLLYLLPWSPLFVLAWFGVRRLWRWRKRGR